MEMLPICPICKEQKFEIVVIEDLGKKIVCKDCFDKHREELIEEALAAKAKRSFGRRPMMAGNSFEQPKPDANSFLTNLTEEVKENFDPVLFREKELQRVIQVLLRKTKNNPVLIGEAGVGKTAVADLLAHQIANNKIPRLKGYTVYSLSMGSFMSGTKYRGEFEEKFKILIDKLDSKSILFIDEMHLVMGAGGSSQSEIDLSNLLKPYLTKGNLKVIGATTLSEYRKIEKDPAFNRRFQPVKVNPLNKEQTLVVLQKVRPTYEKHHGVEILDDCLESIVDLSAEYILDRHFPDKAIDVLDEACSLISIKHNPLQPDLIKDWEKEFDKLISTLDLDSASAIREKIAEAKKTQKVDSDTILTVVENMTNIPVSKLTKEETERLLKLEAELKKRVIGQEEAVKTLTRAVKRSRLKIERQKKPTVLFFAGPTGVGKTESVKALAESLFGDEEAIIRFDMSEYMEQHSISKLIGTAPGYVGYENEGQLTEKVRRNPYSIILLDEFEKSHPQISNLLLQTFSDGRLTDAKGRTVNFKNTLIILTSNIGVKEKPSVGFGNNPTETKTMNALESVYSPEFLNRIDEIITFKQLNEDDIAKIVDLRINEYQMSLQEKGIELKLEQEAKSYLAKKGYSPTMGARPLARIITREIKDLIVDYLLENEAIQTLVVTELNGELQIA